MFMLMTMAILPCCLVLSVDYMCIFCINRELTNDSTSTLLILCTDTTLILVLLSTRHILVTASRPQL